MSKKRNITGLRHPIYGEMILEWDKFRLAYKGGRDFIDEYLKTFSKREDTTEFLVRRESSYCPAHAKTAVNEIKDAISERLVDIIRKGGPASYQIAVDGMSGGIDNSGSTMNGFISCDLLPELLSMGKVGVYVDRPMLPSMATRSDVANATPYVYTYKAEDILAWNHNNQNQLTEVLLRDFVYNIDNDTKLPQGTETRYRFLKLENENVTVTIYNEAGVVKDEVILNLREIPFVIFKIAQSLMTDIADYQIALLNLGSSDLSYAIKSNFPFYTEQYDPRSFMTDMLKAGSVEDANGDTVSAGTGTEARTAKKQEIHVGTAGGRKYPMGADRPDFIHPSSEPLKASMEKQKALQNEIRELTRLAVKSLASSSSENKVEDSKSVESGLSCIGAELEKGERIIAEIWADYEKEPAAVVKYPENYTLRTDAERRFEVEKLLELLPKLPSDVLKKEIAKQIATILVGHRVSREEMEKIHKEIDNAKVIIMDPEEIRADLEAGLVGNELASSLRGYPEGEVALATIDHENRITRIALAQSKASNDTLNASRGVKDADDGSITPAEEKKESRDTTKDGVVTDKTRGAANG
jgi:hypothetical protein